MTRFYVNISSIDKYFYKVFLPIFENSHPPLEFSGPITAFLFLLFTEVFHNNANAKNFIPSGNKTNGFIDICAKFLVY